VISYAEPSCVRHLFLRVGVIFLGIGGILGMGAMPVAAEVSAEDPLVLPYECEMTATLPSPIDLMVRRVLKEKGITPARPCSDEVFIRRVYLDVIGTLPPKREVLYFINSDDAQKRSKLIDVLLEKEEYVDYWTLKWCDCCG